MEYIVGEAIDRRDLIRGIVLGSPLILIPNAARAVAGGPPIVETESGMVLGIREKGVEVFRGVPYGGDISGRNRFRQAPRVKPWAGVRDALLPGAPSIQPPRAGYGDPPADENCLTLRLFTPASDGKRRPVLFYNHGGGFTTGSGHGRLADGANIAREHDVVVVATNHRLGLLGYLCLDEIAGSDYNASGNNGVLDIVAGLKWVNRNIDRFGGDPNNVMIFGDSGGGLKTSCLYAMPSAAPYFDKASIESGPGIRMTPADVARERTEKVLRELEIDRKDWRKLFDVPAARLLKLQTDMFGSANDTRLQGDRDGIDVTDLGFAPMVDGQFLPSHPFDPVAPAISKNKPLICGYNRDEFAFFSLSRGDVAAFSLDQNGLAERLRQEMPTDYRQAIEVYRKTRPNDSPTDTYIAIRSARFAGAGTVALTERKVQQGGAPVYAYIFSYQLERSIPGTTHPLGAMHALEIPFKFNNVENSAPANGPNFAGARSERFAAGRHMSTMWANFARHGIPSAPGVPTWPAYDTESRPTMIIDSECSVVKDPYSLERSFWEARSADVRPGNRTAS